MDGSTRSFDLLTVCSVATEQPLYLSSLQFYNRKIERARSYLLSPGLSRLGK